MSAVLETLSKNNLGLLNDAVSVRHNQVLWLAVWDHFIGGDSEVHVFVPAATDFPPDLDLIYVSINSWNEIKATLSILGTVKSGEHAIPASIYQSFREDSDFQEAVAFEGEYRGLMATLASHERREDLLPSLRRVDDPQAIIQAFVLAAIDVASQFPQLPSEKEYADEISNKLVQTYAVPRDYSCLASYSKEFGEMLKMLPEGSRRQMNGPLWITEKQFSIAAMNPLGRHPRFEILVNLESTVLLKSPVSQLSEDEQFSLQ